MMGRLERDQGKLFYSFDLEAAVPKDHAVRRPCPRTLMGAQRVRAVDPELLIRIMLLG